MSLTSASFAGPCECFSHITPIVSLGKESMSSNKLRGGTRRIIHLAVSVLLFCGFAMSAASAEAQVSIAWVDEGQNGVFPAPAAVTSDAQGNVYTIGTSTAPLTAPTQQLAITFKYDLNGINIWRGWQGGETFFTQAVDIGADAVGNVYSLVQIDTTSQFQSGPHYQEMAVLKYEPRSTSPAIRVWIQSFPSAGGSVLPFKMVVTPSGNVYVTGTIYSGTTTPLRAVTLKYDTSGTLMWERVSPVGGTNHVTGFGVDATENVYVAVTSSHFYPTVYKYDTAGNLLGSFATKAVDDFNAFRVDALGNYYAGGCFAPGPAVVKFDTNGNEVWSYHPSVTATTCFSSIQIDSLGDVVFSQTSHPGGPSSFASILTKLDVNGNLQWETNSSTDSQLLAAIDSSDQIYTVGQNTRVVAAKFSPDGQQVWRITVPHDTKGLDIAGPTTLAGGNRLIIAGRTQALNPNGDPIAGFNQLVVALSQP